MRPIDRSAFEHRSAPSSQSWQQANVELSQRVHNEFLRVAGAFATIGRDVPIHLESTSRNAYAVNTARITSACQRNGGVVLPPGSYPVGTIALAGLNGCYVRGSGIGRTYLRTTGGPAFVFDNCADVSLRDLSVSAGPYDAVRVSRTSGLFCEHVEASYSNRGIVVDGGTNRRIFIRACHVHHTASDGIYYNSVSGVVPGAGWTDLVAAIISDCFVWQFGLDGASGGIHVDRSALINNCNVTAFGIPQLVVTTANSSIGIWVGTEGEDADRSAVTNCFVFPNLRGNGSAGTDPDFTDAPEGIRIDADNCRVVNCTPHGSFWGISVRGVRNQVIGCYADQCAYGFFAHEDAGFTRFTNCSGTGSVGSGGPGAGFRIAGDNCVVENCYARLNTTYGVQVDSTANSTTIFNCNLSGNTVGPILDNGAGTRQFWNPGGEATDWLSLGSNPATSGLLRLPNNAGGVRFRTSGGSNANGLDLSASDNLIVGDDTDVSRVDLYGANGIRSNVGSTLYVEVYESSGPIGRLDAKGCIVETTNEFRANGGFYSFGSGGVTWRTGSGSPESSVTAPVGSIYSDTAGGAGTTLYVKESGTGNTGWVAK